MKASIYLLIWQGGFSTNSGHEDVLIALLGTVHWCRAETRTKHLDRASVGSLVVGIMVTTDSRINGDVDASFAEGVLSRDRA
jgi:hypothetical protein